MKSFNIRIITMSALISSMTFSALSQNTTLGEFDGHTDVGSPNPPGTAWYTESSQEYTLSGSGGSRWSDKDQFHFLWKKMKGDFLLRTRAEFAGKPALAHGKIGWMVRPSLDPDAAFAGGGRYAADATALQFRTSKGARMELTFLPVRSPDVLQLERRGTTFILSAARYGEPLISREVTNLDLGDEVYAGMFICSRNPGAKETAVFHDVRIVIPARTNFVPYRDYIGSVLEILDVASGKLETVYRSKQPIEAPNWTLDGGSLIYNVSGRSAGWGSLVRFDLATKTTTPIDTGMAKQNNNDHVLSFDGKMLGISDQSAFHGGQSAVFTVPVEGGTPKPITRLSPSYMHGWSPDGKYLVYTGGRNDKYDIFKMASDGTGEEIRLTDSPGLNDGPQYSPDGKYIYFNSSRGGRMQVWRMKPDGSDQEQLTNDEYNNWFPHLSPDGQWIVMISFPGDISPTDHPYYKHVYLRLMPAAGGPAKVIAYVYGGQGTMNVPSWSPDSKRLAFVSNTDIP
jgi:tricorn protease-like protein